MVNIGSTSTGGRVIAIKNDLAKLALTAPVCTQAGEKLALSRRVVRAPCAFRDENVRARVQV